MNKIEVRFNTAFYQLGCLNNTRAQTFWILSFFMFIFIHLFIYLVRVYVWILYEKNVIKLKWNVHWLNYYYHYCYYYYHYYYYYYYYHYYYVSFITATVDDSWLCFFSVSGLYFSLWQRNVLILLTTNAHPLFPLPLLFSFCLPYYLLIFIV